MLPEIVDSTAVVGAASALSGSPLIAGLVGDQQASLIGQGQLVPGSAKITFGTGAMLDRTLGICDQPPSRGAHGTFPIVAWRDRGDGTVFGLEGVVLSAGSAVDWLVDGLGILSHPSESGPVAGTVRDSGGAMFVPALGGIGTPLWDHGARGTLTGISATTGRAEVVRAVLEGVAHRGRDLIEAIEEDSGSPISELAVDGGMSANPLFVQLVANAANRPILRSRLTEATTLGAAMLAGVADRRWSNLAEAASIVPTPERIEPTGTLDRERWLDAGTGAPLGAGALDARRSEPQRHDRAALPKDVRPHDSCGDDHAFDAELVATADEGAGELGVDGTYRQCARLDFHHVPAPARASSTSRDSRWLMSAPASARISVIPATIPGLFAPETESAIDDAEVNGSGVMLMGRTAMNRSSSSATWPSASSISRPSEIVPESRTRTIANCPSSKVIAESPISHPWAAIASVTPETMPGRFVPTAWSEKSGMRHRTFRCGPNVNAPGLSPPRRWRPRRGGG